ncbi:hypothetical protein, partial [Porphyromonas gulae]|uniref:hypothetical protein n=1 Tax=Porphyromonas gulae TaxID=111105 RepID=UPI001F3FEE84
EKHPEKTYINPQSRPHALLPTRKTQKYPSKAKTGGLTNTKPKRKGAAPKMNFDTAPICLERV